MKRLMRVILLLAFLASGLLYASPATAQVPVAVPGPCVNGPILVGALTMYCVPSSGWNGDLVVFAHGYTAFNEPLGFQNLSFTAPDGTQIYLPTLVQSLGYAFATTSYRRNGLAILEGVDDMRHLTKAFHRVTGLTANRVIIAGASEGGVVTTLSVERYPKDYAGGLSLCGPIGDFRSQIDYWEDFRVLFDVFFPTVLPPSPISIPDDVINTWDSVYVPKIAQALMSNPTNTGLLLATSGAPYVPAVPQTAGETVLGILWYNVFATNDGLQQLKGNPYDNMNRAYTGSANDILLNAVVQRFAADESALAHLRRYNTTGQLSVPLVTMHTTGDPIVPFWHEALYAQKVTAAGSTAMLMQIPVDRYGHCSFTQNEIAGAFSALVMMVNAQPAP